MRWNIFLLNGELSQLHKSAPSEYVATKRDFNSKRHDLTHIHSFNLSHSYLYFSGWPLHLNWHRTAWKNRKTEIPTGASSIVKIKEMMNSCLLLGIERITHNEKLDSLYSWVTIFCHSFCWIAFTYVKIL